MLDETRRILGDLIGFPTVSADGNLALIAYASAALDAIGAHTRTTLDASGTKANLFATIGPDTDGGIVLSGHTDVVPADGEWTGDPFVAHEEGGRIYGRGACDMKGFIACALAMAPAFAATRLERPVHFAFTYDEEVGCFGARALVEALREWSVKPSTCVIGEPTGMRIIEGHKGCYEYTTAFTGSAGHASEPDRGVNAIAYAGRFLARLAETGEALKGRAPAKSPFVPPWTTLQAGVIRGGTARNVIPDHCEVEWEMRPVTAADADFALSEIRRCLEGELSPEMRARHPGAGIVTHVVGEVDGLEPVAPSEALDLVRELTGGNAADVVSFGTEAGLYQKAGISTVVCGPGFIEQAHRPDEYVSLDQLDLCLQMLDRLAGKLSRRS
ncbi:Acetylornithine deacetylase [Lutibaculum baratangense AMV1]|uniref:Acetylornithine deacetylase n=1 Tax=Lutibaculum baratangense AMV1 TaxID=631454 RepID=V4TC76_9HYPH|nr:Acetylornithine deacetylase [Lutibaculum baratangense AMV1]